jgi:hypothetical protein
MKRSLQSLARRFEALSPRGRACLAAAVPALLAGLAWHGAAGLHDKPRLAEASAAAVHASQLASRAEPDVRGARIGRQLAGLGLDQVSVHSPTGSIVGALQGTRASLVSLRGLPVQQVPAAAASAAKAEAVGTPMLFRHRAEIRLQGSIIELTQALETLEHGVVPLRIEQVLISSADSGPALQATVVLTAVNQERNWFAL